MKTQEQMDRILIVCLSRIDGLLLHMPMIRELRYALPEARIDLLVPDSNVEFAHLAPYPNFILSLPETVIGRFLFLRDSFFMRKRRRYYDVAFLIAPAKSLWFAKLLAKCVGCRKICFYGTEAGKTISEDSVVELAPCGKHEVVAGLRMLSAFGIEPKDDSLPFWERPSNRKKVSAWEELFGDVPIGKRILCCPHSSRQSDNWPELRYLSLFQRLRDEAGALIVLCGAKADLPSAERICYALEDKGIVSLCGKIDAGDEALLASQTAFYLGPSTSWIHFAAAARKPCVILSPHVESSREERMTPWQVPFRILRPAKSLPPCRGVCSSKKPHCIAGVRLENVLQAALEFLC